MWKNIIIVAVLVVVVLFGAFWYGQQHHTTAINDNSSVRLVVNQFGSTIQKVSLAAPNAKDLIGAAYSPYVSADLLAQWKANTPFAPGKGVSSPWPDRIQVDSMTEQPDGSYVVKATAIEVTSNEVAHGGIAAQYPVTMTLKKTGDQWLITTFDRGVEVMTPHPSTGSGQATSTR